MTDIERDPLVRRAVDELRRPNATDHAAVARVVAAAAAARIAAADDDVPTDSKRPRRVHGWTLGGVAAAAALVGFIASSARHPAAESNALPTVAANRMSEASVALQPVGSNSADALPITKQFVFHSRTARNVSVVGDFNRWNAESARMTRASDGDLWSVTLPIVPGRHMYGFMVDDSLFTLDPREPKGRDADLGVEASVIIVGRP